jgi:hypothetical protein
MSYPALPAALKSLEDLRRFAESSERKVAAVKQVLALDLVAEGPALDWAREVSEFTSGRTYDYVCSIVLLYGILERFIEELAEEYVTDLVRATSKYETLPSKLRQSHFDLTLTHLQRTRDSRYDGRVNATQLASALSGCLAGQQPYDVIAESMLHHTSNFRVPVIDEFFGRLNIPSASRRCIFTPEFENYMAVMGLTAPQDRPEVTLDLVNDLVTRRNQVAHGDTSNTLGPSELVPYCRQVEAYCRALSTVLYEAFIGHVAENYGFDHGFPIAVYNHNIVCIQSNGMELRTGSMLALQRPDQTWYPVKIVRIEIDRVAVENVPAGNNEKVGLEIDGRCKEKYRVNSITL